MKIFETHAHLDFPEYNKDRKEILDKCFNAGIEYIINIGIDRDTSEKSIKLAEQYEKIYAAAGCHPHNAKKFDRNAVIRLSKHPKVVAIGEIGLDFYRNLSPQDVQKDVFEQQILIALEMNLPIIVHDRDAHMECFNILEKHNPSKVVFHCFSGDELFAEKVIEKGWNISFTGNITYKKNTLENVVRLVPMEHFFIETDCPFLSPVPCRGKRNSPLNLRYIIEKIADIKRISPKHVAEASFNNAVEFFLS
jgi:TatD DNase family protein